MNEKEPVLEALRQQKAAADTEPDLEPVREEWIKQVTRLIDQITSWLKPAVDEGLIRVEPLTVLLSEEWVDDYECPGLRIRTPKGQRIDVKPHARFVLGYEGRIDLVSGPRRAMLLQMSPDQWSIGEFVLGQIKPIPLTEETFWPLIHGLLLA